MPEGGLVVTQDGLVLVVPDEEAEGPVVAINQSCCCGQCPKEFYLACNITCCTREGCEYVPSPGGFGGGSSCNGDECCEPGSKIDPKGCSVKNAICRDSLSRDGRPAPENWDGDPRDCKGFGIPNGHGTCAEEFIASLP